MGMKPPGSGRQKGTPNKTTRQMRELFRGYGPEAQARLVNMMRTTTDDELRLKVIHEILDRGYGKASRTVELEASRDYSNCTNEELVRRLEKVRASLLQKPLQITAREPHIEAEVEVVDGGVVVPDPVGLNPAGEKPQGGDKP